MNGIKTLLTGLACSLFLLSCGGGDDNETGVHEEVCHQFKQYKGCTERLTRNNFLQCEKDYDVQMKRLRAKYGNATIPTKEGFDYQEVRDSLERCVDHIESNNLFDQLKQCLLNFQNRVLDGFQCWPSPGLTDTL